MGLAIQMTKAYFDSKGLKYRAHDDGKALFVSFSGLKNKGTLEILIVFDDDDRAVAIRGMDVSSAPEEKWPQLFKICSELNYKYRWVKFCIQKGRKQVSAEDDAVITPETAGEEVYELIIRMVRIVDQAYPEIMRGIWA